jgi:hypothetical protein
MLKRPLSGQLSRPPLGQQGAGPQRHPLRAFAVTERHRTDRGERPGPIDLAGGLRHRRFRLRDRRARRLPLPTQRPVIEPQQYRPSRNRITRLNQNVGNHRGSIAAQSRHSLGNNDTGVRRTFKHAIDANHHHRAVIDGKDRRRFGPARGKRGHQPDRNETRRPRPRNTADHLEDITHGLSVEGTTGRSGKSARRTRARSTSRAARLREANA